ncbi:hypothetical protein ACQ4PT_045106 [Festuca glaucescens]
MGYGLGWLDVLEKLGLYGHIEKETRLHFLPNSPDEDLRTLPSSAMATATRRLLPTLLRTLAGTGHAGAVRGLATEKAVGAAAVVGSHTAKWMQDTSKKSPMELINEVPPIKVEGRIVCCEGDKNPALGHPIEYICLDLDAPAVCKYCGLRYVQDHHH